MLLVALLSCTIPFLVVSASSSATAEAISSARFAEFSARIAAASAALLLCDADTALPAASVAFVDAVDALPAAAVFASAAAEALRSAAVSDDLAFVSDVFAALAEFS
ncbi:hypothetical protein SLK26_004794, partial [Escherichia coli]|nr:hypothetical protein [Escherichia coli]